MRDIQGLLTTRQLQELLQVDRITIYRMLNDGRLEGFKIGGQWRFSRLAIERWLQEQGGSSQESEHSVSAPEYPLSLEDLPLHCMQAIQAIMAEALGVGAIITTLDGAPLTTMSNPNPFCELVLSTEVGQERCMASWRQAATSDLARVTEGVRMPLAKTATCHSGLGYVWDCIEIGGQPVANVHAGQFLSIQADLDESRDLPELSAACGVPVEELRKALASARVLGQDEQAHLSRLLGRVAEALSEIAEERLSLMGRLQRIADMTKLE